MQGTIVNTVAVLAGGSVGLLLRRRIPDRMRETVMMGIGLATLLIGMQMALQTQNVLGVIVSLAAGGVIGEALHLEDGIEILSRWAERHVGGAGETQTSATAFVTSSLLFCVGPMTVLGAIQDGLGQPPVLLYTKSMLDGISAVAIGAALGAGVLLSAVTVFVYQGAITLAAGALQGALSPAMTRELTATGGVLIVGLGLGILQIRRIRVGNLVPALAVTVVLEGVAPWVSHLARALGW
ncbi:MAG: DUF554 domain-containing protein [Armatimonadota bacterium]|nr:DUF554 domain-containing protein [Armatimonadota bacterium]MDR7551138.1 DUF554 domain-containing protein [Armatimonadota bacterium]